MREEILQPRFRRSVFDRDMLSKEELLNELSNFRINKEYDEYNCEKLEALLRDILHTRRYSYRTSETNRLNDMAMCVMFAIKTLQEKEWEGLCSNNDVELDNFLSKFNVIKTEVVQL